MAELGIAVGGGHTRILSGDVVWCISCGSYANIRAVGFAAPCGGTPPKTAGRYWQLRACLLASTLRRGRGSRRRCARTAVLVPACTRSLAVSSTTRSSSRIVAAVAVEAACVGVPVVVYAEPKCHQPMRPSRPLSCLPASVPRRLRRSGPWMGAALLAQEAHRVVAMQSAMLKSLIFDGAVAGSTRWVRTLG